MLTFADLTSELTAALKRQDHLALGVLRALKTRVQNEQIALGHDLTDSDFLALVQSEVKRRREAATMYESGGRTELAAQEQAEIQVLSQFLPTQLSADEVKAVVEQELAAHNWSKADFGAAMSALKAKLGLTVDGKLLSEILKEKLS